MTAAMLSHRLTRGAAKALAVAALLLLLFSMACSAAGAKSGAALSLNNSLVALLHEVPAVWSIAVSATHDEAAATAGDGDEDAEGVALVELGAVRLERPSASAAAMYLPAAVAGGRLPFTTISCEEYRLGTGKCFFFGSEEGEEEEEELYVDYTIANRRRRSTRVSGAAKADGSDEKTEAGETAPRGAAAAAVPLWRLDAGGQGGAAVEAGSVRVLAERLTRSAAGGVESKEYILRLALSGGRLPAVLELRGVTGDVQARLAALQQRHKVRAASTFFSKWVYPLCYVAALYGVVWAVKSAADRRAAAQERKNSATRAAHA